MKNQFIISVFSENKVGLLTKVCSVFTRRNINIESLTVSESEIKGVHRFTVVVSVEEELVIKITKQIEKQIDVLKAFFHRNEEMVYQEIAMYKLPTSLMLTGGSVEKIIRSHQARVLAIEEDFTILEKTGHKEETQKLYDLLAPYGLLEFVRSGRIAISKPMKELKEYLAELKIANAY